MHTLTGIALLFSATLALTVRDVKGATIYRIGKPFTATEKDSLEGVGYLGNIKGLFLCTVK